ncbi:ankyrin repeat-containing protein [Xylariomycetidae sp. FL2044]|nr:ankyrin repeat-containing protein [Xylariomycetidae sp. FL2044]
MSSSTEPQGLHEAIQAGDTEAVKNFYMTSETNGQPALLASVACRAARMQQPQILEWCFDVGLTLPQDTLNDELYEQACLSRSPAVFAVLLKHGLDYNTHHSEFFGDGLSLAAYHGDVTLARFLLENGADPNQAWGYQEYEAGVWVIVGPNPSPEILRLMLSHGWTQKDSSAHIAAAETGDLATLKLLLEASPGPDIEASEAWWPTPSENDDDKWGTALYRAALKGKTEVVAYLLEKGADPEFRDKMGRSCAWAAKEGGSESVLRMLEERGIKE